MEILGVPEVVFRDDLLGGPPSVAGSESRVAALRITMHLRKGAGR